MPVIARAVSPGPGLASGSPSARSSTYAGQRGSSSNRHGKVGRIGLPSEGRLRWLYLREESAIRRKYHLWTCYAAGQSDVFPLPGENTNRNVAGVGLWQSLLEPVEARLPVNPDPELTNGDFAPTLPNKRMFTFWDMICLWVGLIVAIPNYYLAGSLVELGMSWWQGISTVFVANSLILFPMVMNGHAGTKYGIPFPVLSRASFGIRGAQIPSILRAIVACGWFGIQTWVGGQAIFQLLNIFQHGALTSPALPILGTSLPELCCYLAFWSIQMAIIWNGIESIKSLERWSAPILVLMCTALLVWALVRAGGLGPMLSSPSQFRLGGPQEGQFWRVFLPAVTANVGAWATLSLNIPDFTRFAITQRDQAAGQAVGLPLFMAAFAFVGLAVTSATVAIFGHPISDPVQLLGEIKGLLPVTLSVLGVLLATLSTNIAANVVAPANALVNLRPSAISFRAGCVATALLSLVTILWRPMESAQGFLFTWLIGYSAVMGPIAGIVVADYWFLRKRVLDVDALYSSNTADTYWYHEGVNPAAIAALLVGTAPSVPGFLAAVNTGLPRVHPYLAAVYDGAWIVGFFVASVVYLLLMRGSRGNPRNVRTGGEIKRVS